MSNTPKRLAQSILRGLQGRCPSCGEASIYRAYIKVRDACPKCHQALGHYPADDAPPYLTIILLAHILVPLFLYIDHVYSPPMELILLFSLPITLGCILGAMPFIKGGVVGVLYYLDK